ncbi:MAG: CoA transferase [Alphaproteobacteria bacterium]
MAGLKIVDICTVVAGPICTQMFADNGANVIKIELPIGDESRRMGPPTVMGCRRISPVSTATSGALHWTLNTPQARVLLKLLEDADVLAVNFKPGTGEMGSRLRRLSSAIAFRA